MAKVIKKQKLPIAPGKKRPDYLKDEFRKGYGKPTHVRMAEERELLKDPSRFILQQTLTKDMILRSICRDSYFQFVKTFWHTIVPEKPHWNWHIEFECNEIQKRLERVFAGQPKQDDLVYNQPPGTSKSLVFSVMLLPWAWTRMPTFRMIGASHTLQPLALNLSRLSRAVIKSELYRKLFPEISLAEDQDTKTNYANTQGGQRYAVGSNGSVLGMHAHCFPAGTMIETEKGSIDIAEIVNNKKQIKVMTWNPKTCQFGFHPIRAWMKTENQQVFTVKFTDGTELQGTSDHPVFVNNKGWVLLSQLVSGDEVIYAKPNMQNMSNQFPQVSIRNNKKKNKKCILFKNMLREMDIPKQKRYKSQELPLCNNFENLHKMQPQDESKSKKITYSKVLFKAMSSTTPKRNVSPFMEKQIYDIVQNMRSNYVFEKSSIIPKIWKNSLLFKTMCQSIPSKTNERKRKPKIYSRQFTQKIQTGFYQNPGNDKKTGKQQMFLLSSNSTRYETCGASHKLQQKRQSENKLSCSLSFLSWKNARKSKIKIEVGKKTVQSIIHPLPLPQTVYNLDIAQDHTYFANNVLVHNCIVIDDPIDPQQALSETELERVNTWITGELITRKVSSSISVVFMVMQRLHQDDPSARMAKRPRVTQYVLPATLDYPVKPETLQQFYTNSLFDPIRLPASVLEEKRVELGDYQYAGQYGQDPVPLGGGTFKIEKLQKGTPPTKYKRQVIFWDKAISQQKRAAYTCGVHLAEDYEGRLWVLNVWRDRLDSYSREKLIKNVAQKHGTEVIYGIEQEPGSGGKESAERTAIQTLRGFKCVIIKPTGDKETRADPFSVQWNLKNIFTPNDLWDHEKPVKWLQIYLDEFRHWPHSKYKDQVDATAGAFTVLCKSKIRIGGLKPSKNYQEKVNQDRY